MTALTSALSGLRVHQFFIDVIGNNLANANTTGYLGSRATFADLLSQTIRPASSPTANLGGKNPVQVGLGVMVHSVDVRTQQGVLNDTGRPFDLGIQGNGYFILNDGSRNVYTRAGVFGLDQNNFLVDTSSGFRVQNVQGTDIQLAVGEIMPAQITSLIQLGGNLPARITGPLAEELNTTNAFEEGTAASLTGSVSEPFNLSGGESMQITVDGGVPVTVTFAATDFATPGAATAAEVAAVIAAQVPGLTADGSTGALILTSSRTGESSSIKVDEGTGTPAQVLGLSTTLSSGTQFTATAATLLNDLASNATDYVNGDVIEITGTSASGQPFAGSFAYGVDGTALGDLVTFMDGLISDATVSLDAAGNIVITADSTGEASLFVSIADSPTSTGSTLFSSHGFVTITEGQGPDESRTSVDVFDTRGLRHTLTLTLTRVNGTDWDLVVTSDNPADTIVDGAIDGIRFNPDGSFSAVTGSGVGDLGIEVLFDGLTASQAINVDLGTSGALDGVTQLGDQDSLRVLSQDGFAAGELVTLSVNSDGAIQGFYSNGQSQTLDQVALATFNNASGLSRVGNNMFEESVNSGVAQVLSAGTGGAGSIFSGVLEASNVDTAEEFVRLIEAQRGFQANARVIRVSDELLQEVVNIV